MDFFEILKDSFSSSLNLISTSKFQGKTNNFTIKSVDLQQILGFIEVPYDIYLHTEERLRRP